MRLISGILFLVLLFIFIKPGIATFFSEQPACKIVIDTGDIVHPKFGGVGFHFYAHYHDDTKEHFEQVITKRWRELNPSFVRMNDLWDWDKEVWDRMATYILFFKTTGTEVYTTTWNPKDTKEGKDRTDYAKRIVDNLEYLVRQKGATNLKYYCMTNELTLNEWGALRDDILKFKDYHNELYKEIKARKLDIQLLATDASPIDRWGTIEWATENMDDITGVYGGHHYINQYKPEDEAFYPWFLSKMKWGAGMAKKKNKNFIIGEFGSEQDGRIINGKKMDTCIYWDTGREPLVGIQLSEAVIAALNGGIYALGYWTFSDLPDYYRQDYINKWGLFKWSGKDYSTRATYYAYGLLTKFFRGPAAVFKVSSDNGLLRVAAVSHNDAGTYSIAIVNRNTNDVPVNINLKTLSAKFRKYVYDPQNIPWSPFGDLQGPSYRVTMKDGLLTDTVGAGTLTVYTTAFDEQPPAAVKNIIVEKNSEGRNLIRWQQNTEADFCYYRIFRSTKKGFVPGAQTRIGSTIAAEFIDETTSDNVRYYYKVIAVDQSGNAGEG
jgi:hypothetical protein